MAFSPQPTGRPHSPAELIAHDDAPAVDRDRDRDEAAAEYDDGGRPEPVEADRDENERPGQEVEAESIAELDPALAEVHEIDEGDDEDREEGAADQPAPAVAPRRPGDQEVGGARRDHARPDGARQGQRAGGGEQRALSAAGLDQR